MPTDDHALKALRDLRAKTDSALPWELLAGCYELQRRCQYDQKRDESLDGLRRLVEGYVEKAMGSDRTDGDQP